MENNTINILFYDPSSGFAGSAGALTNLIRHLNRERFNPFLAIKNFGPQFERLKDIEVIKLKNYDEPEKASKISFFFHFIRNILPEAIKIYFVIKKKKISFVHTNTSVMGGMAAIIASRLAGIHCICHFRGTRNLLKREIFCTRWIDRFIVLNTHAFDSFRQIMGDEKVRLVFDGLDFSDFQRIETGLFRKELNLNSVALIGLVSRIVRGKGHKEFILSAKEVLKTRPNTKIVIVGDVKGENDSYYKEVKEFVRKEAMEQNLLFTGWRTDIKNIISDLDVLVFSTTTFPEGLPNTIIEAMALGKSVVATDIPGPKDIVLNGVTGFLVPAGDVKAMTEKIIYLLDNRDIAIQMGEEGRRRTEELFDIRHSVKQIERIYEEIINESN
jgi:glycosyltransferase involved in cell wall biosynthesis